MSKKPDVGPKDYLPNYKRGIFEWKRRMGEHMAYHEAPNNKILHCICIPVFWYGLIQIMTLLGFYLPEILIVSMGPIFLLIEPLCGAVMISLLYIVYVLAGFARNYYSPLPLLVVSILCVVASFLTQTVVGHRLFEEDCRSDTNKNMKEFKATKNPLPLILVFYYHIVELVLLTGYRTDLREEIRKFTEKEKKSEYYKAYNKIQL